MESVLKVEGEDRINEGIDIFITNKIFSSIMEGI
jgi:hypothetical protein